MAVLAVQRFVVMSDLPVSKSDEHENIGEQLSWAMGSFGLAPVLGVSSSWLPETSKHISRPGRQLARARRQLLECTPPAPPPSDTPLSLPPALPPTPPLDQCDSGTLNDRLLTLGVVLAVALVLQIGAHILWKYILNGRYYLHLLLNSANVDGDGKLSREKQQKALSPPPSPPDESGAQLNSPQGGGSSRALALARSKGSLTNLVRSSKALLGKQRRQQGLREGKLAPIPAGAPPLSKVSTAKFLSSLSRGSSSVRRGPSCNALARARALSSVASSSRAEDLRGHDSTADRDGRTTGDVTTENNQPEIAKRLEFEGPNKSGMQIRFYPFPSWLRWPTIPLYVCICCLSGLVQSAFASFSLCGQNFISILPLVIVVVVLALMWTQLVVFHCRHRQAMWRSNKQQQLRQPDGDKWLDRAQRWQRGEFAKDKRETCEPERTERLLAKPLLFFSRCPADAYESMAVTVLFRCRGDAKHAMAYHMGKLSAQLAVVALASSGAALAEGNSAASSLAISALVIQVGVFSWIVCGRPSVDRMDWLVHAASWGSDSATTALLVIPAWAESNGEELATAALLFALLGMALPMVKLVGNCLRTLYRLTFNRRAIRHAGEGKEAEAEGGQLDAKDEVDPGCMEQAEDKAAARLQAAKRGQRARREVADRRLAAAAAAEAAAAAVEAEAEAAAAEDKAAARLQLRPKREKPSLNKQPSLKAAIRTVQIAQHVQRKHTQRRQGLLEGVHAPTPAGVPPISKTTTAAFLSSLNAVACLDAAAAATAAAPALNSDLARSAIALFAPSATASAPAASAPAMPRKMTLKVAARTVQTTVHMERKLTKKREGLREGRHLALPPGLPQGPPPTAEEPPEPGRLALRRVRQAQLEA